MVITKSIVDPNFHHKVMFSDEVIFSRDRIFNFRNCYVWAQIKYTKSQWVTYQHKFAVDVWAFILSNKVIEAVVAR